MKERENLNKLSENISILRSSGKIEQAIESCEEALKQYPSNNFYPMILGDLYFQVQAYDSCMKSYIKFLEKSANRRDLFNDFARRYKRLVNVLTKSDIKEFNTMIYTITKSGRLDDWFIDQCNKLIKSNISTVGFLKDTQLSIDLLDNDSNFKTLIPILKKIEDLDIYDLYFIIDEVLKREYNLKTVRIDTYFISVCERLGKYKEALEIAERVLSLKHDSVVIRSVFRICRKMENYDQVDKLLMQYPEIMKNDDFNILYELVYYFEQQKDIDSVKSTLKKIEKNSVGSRPINQTLKNFYLRFGLLDDAKRIEVKINELRLKGVKFNNKFSDEVQETEEGIWSKIRELYSELEHQKQLAAVSELTRGISHESGQPITNIRYTVQFYQRLIEINFKKELISTAFSSILEETERMGALIKRLSPLTSNKSVVESFNIIELIRKRVKAENLRLQGLNIAVNIHPSKPVYLYADPVKFEQIISNLMINSIYAIKEKQNLNQQNENQNYINIFIEDKQNLVRIVLEDSGVGVPLKHSRKIFDPFYSTKPPGDGEGLGLFIVWNILKMHGGKISLDHKYRNGAKFILDIPRRGLNNEK